MRLLASLTQESGWIDEDEEDDDGNAPATTVYARLQPSGNIAFSLDEDDDYVPYDEQDVDSDDDEDEEEEEDGSDEDAFDLIAGGDGGDGDDAMPGAFPRRSARVGGGGGGAGPGIDGLAGEQEAEMSPLRSGSPPFFRLWPRTSARDLRHVLGSASRAHDRIGSVGTRKQPACCSSAGTGSWCHSTIYDPRQHSSCASRKRIDLG